MRCFPGSFRAATRGGPSNGATRAQKHDVLATSQLSRPSSSALERPPPPAPSVCPLKTPSFSHEGRLSFLATTAT